MSENISPFPRAVRSAPPPLALYIRPSRNDHKVLLDLIASGDAACFGAVIDPSVLPRHSELKDQILSHRLDAILDPRTQQLALPGSYSPALGSLPWANSERPHVCDDFRDLAGRRLSFALADYVLEHGFTQVLAPTHFLSSADDPWVSIDIETTRQLRNQLDRNHGKDIPIIYSLAIPYAVFRNQEQRKKIIAHLSNAPIAAVWLKIDGVGSGGTATATRTYIQAASDFHELGVPIIADHMGGVTGLSLLAFGAVSGIAHGITMSERFDASSWHKPRQPSGGFSMSPRVYIPALDLLLKREVAQKLMDSSNRAKSLFGCTDTNCCARGVKDMLANPGRHFLYQRMKEVNSLSQIPETLRPQRFLDQHLRPTTDKAVAAAGINWEETELATKMQDNRKRLDALRVALGNLAESSPPKSFAAIPETRVAREIRR